MFTLAANLSMLFTEHPFSARFAAAARHGFRAVEYLFPYSFAPEELAAHLHETGLQQALFNLPPGDWERGERGLACLPGREEEFCLGVEQAIDYARHLGNHRVHAMAGIRPDGVTDDVLERTYVENLRRAARRMAEHDLLLCIEPINQRSMPGYFLNRQEQAVRMIKAVGEPNVCLQFDMFHVQMEEGCVTLKLREYFPYIGHVQIAGVPDRHEPDTGELAYAYVFDCLDELGYTGFVGCEYIPLNKTADGLGWMQRLSV